MSEHDTDVEHLLSAHEELDRQGEMLQKLVAHARAVRSGRPLSSFVMSAVEMSEIVIELFDS